MTRALTLLCIAATLWGCESFPEREFDDPDAQDTGGDTAGDAGGDVETDSRDEPDTGGDVADTGDAADTGDEQDVPDGEDDGGDDVDAEDADQDADGGCEENACGGCEPLAVEIGSACGTCDSGVWECDPTGEPTCIGDQGDAALNACGGCGVLPNRLAPGDVCDNCPLKIARCRGPLEIVCEVPDRPALAEPIGEGSYALGQNAEASFTYRFAMARTEVTQSRWREAGFPIRGRGCSECPITEINFLEALAFANVLSENHDLDPCYRTANDNVYSLEHALREQPPQPHWPRGAECNGYRLPTEAEWAAAARFGSEGQGLYGPIDEIAWFVGNSDQQTHPVSCKTSNRLGLFDVVGNVREYTWDQFTQLPEGEVVDYTAPGNIHGSTARSSHYFDGPRETTLFSRIQVHPLERDELTGFRLVRTIR